MHGLSALEIISAAFCTSTGSANVFDEALYFPASGKTALLIGIEESSISLGISKNDGPKDPFLVSLKAIDTMSAHLSVDITVAANFVIGCIMST